MKQVSEYFGELHEAGDPSKMLRVISNFLTVFDATLDEIKVCGNYLILRLLHQDARTIAWKASICWTAFQQAIAVVSPFICPVRLNVFIADGQTM